MRMTIVDLSAAPEGTTVPANVVLGDDCYLEVVRETFERFRSTRQPGVMLGKGVRVYHGTRFSIERLLRNSGGLLDR